MYFNKIEIMNYEFYKQSLLRHFFNNQYYENILMTYYKASHIQNSASRANYIPGIKVFLFIIKQRTNL